MFSAAEATTCSAIRDGAIKRVGRSTHPGQQRTDLRRGDPHPELLRHLSSQFTIGQILAEEPNEIVCMMSIENQCSENRYRRTDDRGNNARQWLNIGSR